MDEPRDFATGLVVGALVGIGFGLMFAPTRGEIMRERMRQRGEELLGRARAAGDRTMGQVSDVVRRGQEQASDAVRRGKDLLSDAADSASSAASRLKQKPGET